MRPEVRLNRLERLTHSSLEVKRVQAVEEEQSAHHAIVNTFIENLLPGFPCLLDITEEPFETGSMEFEDPLGHFLQASPCSRVNHMV